MSFARFMTNNHIDSDTTITASSALSSFPVSNILNDIRQKAWIPEGNFTVDSTNKNIYINDGANKTVALTEASYTYSALATHIATQLNASSSNWSCSYDLSGGTYKFTISNTGSVTLRLTQTTNAAWDMLGYTGVSDDTGTSFVADESRNHTHESVVFDMGASTEVQAFLMVAPKGAFINFSTNATIKIQANSSDVWTSPPIDVTLTDSDEILVNFWDSASFPSYRYWRFYFEDRENALGPQGFKVSNIYLGTRKDYTRNINVGFGTVQLDPSAINVSESGVQYFTERNKLTSFGGLQLNLLPKADKDDLKTVINNHGVTKPFYVCFDTDLTITDSYDELTRYVLFDGMPSFQHRYFDYFDMNFQLVEAL